MHTVIQICKFVLIDSKGFRRLVVENLQVVDLLFFFFFFNNIQSPLVACSDNQVELNEIQKTSN